MIINFQITKPFSGLFGWENGRCPDIAFSGHQNDENELNEKLNKKTHLTVTLIFGLANIKLLFYSP